MACCLTAPSHYLDQCELDIIGIQPSAIPRTENAQDIEGEII